MIDAGMSATNTGEGEAKVEPSEIALEVEAPASAGGPVIEISEAEAREFGIDVGDGSSEMPAPETPPEAVAAEATPPPEPPREDPRVQELQTALSKLQETHRTLDDKSKQNYERLLRATADLDNLRKRTRREIDDAKVDAKGKVLREILPVLDNLERAMAHAGTLAEADSKGIVAGVELVQRQFVQALERCGVKPLDVLHTMFDPNMHEAVGQKESAEHPAGTVVEVFQRGYMVGERLLRPALVVVSRVPAPPPAPVPEAPPVEAAPAVEVEVEVPAEAAPAPAAGEVATNTLADATTIVDPPSEPDVSERHRATTIPYSGIPADGPKAVGESDGEAS